jgi:hypothetical protein
MQRARNTTPARDGLPPPAPPRYRLVTEPGRYSVLDVEAVDDDGAVRLGRRLSRDLESAPDGGGAWTSYRVERYDGPDWRLLRAWMPRR